MNGVSQPCPHLCRPASSSLRDSMKISGYSGQPCLGPVPWPPSPTASLPLHHHLCIGVDFLQVIYHSPGYTPCYITIAAVQPVRFSTSRKVARNSRPSVCAISTHCVRTNRLSSRRRPLRNPLCSSPNTPPLSAHAYIHHSI